MFVDPDILITYGATIQKVKKSDFIFYENSEPHFFYQILEGCVKMVSVNLDGKELVQGNFKSGQSFGEPPLFINKPYPSSAFAVSDCIILKISKEKICSLITDRPEIGISIVESLSKKLYKKAVMSSILASNNPSEKIITYFNYLKEKTASNELFKIDQTRQEIADSTGMCVETVIRTLMKLSKEGKVKIEKHKVYY